LRSLLIPQLTSENFYRKKNIMSRDWAAMCISKDVKGMTACNKKAQLTLTNPRNAKAYRKLLQFDVKTSCRQVNDLFEVMQQPSAPSCK